jgi:hypothetical protein
MHEEFESFDVHICGKRPISEPFGVVSDCVDDAAATGSSATGLDVDGAHVAVTVHVVQAFAPCILGSVVGLISPGGYVNERLVGEQIAYGYSSGFGQKRLSDGSDDFVTVDSPGLDCRGAGYDE